jgi:hypothetical protein
MYILVEDTACSPGTTTTTELIEFLYFESPSYRMLPQMVCIPNSNAAISATPYSGTDSSVHSKSLNLPFHRVPMF